MCTDPTFGQVFMANPWPISILIGLAMLVFGAIMIALFIS